MAGYMTPNMTVLGLLAAVLLYAPTAEAYWRMNCGTIQTGRIDSIVSPDKVAGHVHIMAGASNVNVSSTYATLQNASCTSCSVQADKSAYWTPLLYYQHLNGTVEPVQTSGMAVYYLGRGDNTTLTPFPPGFRMLSGNAAARSYDNTTLTWNGYRPIADRVSFNCLDVAPLPETYGMTRTNCKNGLRAQIQFQSCWNGVDLYKTDNSHVAYFSAIDNGVCPPTHPIPLVHLFFEVLYSMDSVTASDGGRFVFSQGDTTGYGFHGDFLNGWDTPTLTAAIKSCAFSSNQGGTSTCAPLAPSDDSNAGSNCPPQPSIVLERVSGLLPALPGCITVTSGPANATSAQMSCPAGTPVPALATATSFLTSPDGWTYLGCTNETAGGRALSSAALSNSSMTASVCRAYCGALGYILAGVEYANECFCGNSLTKGAVLGQKGCTMLCAGDPSQVCGGSSCLGVWQKPYSQPIAPAPAPPPAVAPDGWKYLGCANESASARALSSASVANSTMTAAVCRAFCGARGYNLAGVEYARECYCANSLTQGAVLGQHGCTMACVGDSSQMCGGSSCLGVWQKPYSQPIAPAPAPPPAVAPDGWTYLGCANESASARALSSASVANNTMTAAVCRAFCGARGYGLAGVEYAQECYCANSLTQGAVLGQKGCTMPCVGDSSQMCGGSSCLGVWQKPTTPAAGKGSKVAVGRRLNM